MSCNDISQAPQLKIIVFFLITSQLVIAVLLAKCIFIVSFPLNTSKFNQVFDLGSIGRGSCLFL